MLFYRREHTQNLPLPEIAEMGYHSDAKELPITPVKPVAIHFPSNDDHSDYILARQLQDEEDKRAVQPQVRKTIKFWGYFLHQNVCFFTPICV